MVSYRHSHRLKLLVHNGKEYKPLTVTDEMVGHKLGEFVRTATPWHYKGTPEPPY